jgi:hypothetical protein
VQNYDELVSLLNQAKYLYLRHISEPRDNSLRVVVEEAVETQSNSRSTKALAAQLPEITQVLKGARAITSTDECKRFEFHWSHYVAYLVTEELVGSTGHYEDEVYEGKLLRHYTKSHFLDHLSRDTGGHARPILHYKLICLNHLIDVTSYQPPDIRCLGAISESLDTKIKPNQ